MDTFHELLHVLCCQSPEKYYFMVEQMTTEEVLRAAGEAPEAK